MKSAQDIILKPIISERSAAESMNGRYTFVVAKDTTKPKSVVQLKSYSTSR